MSFFVGIVSADGGRPVADDLRRLTAVAAAFGGAPPRSWSGAGCALAHVQRVYTPEDRAERQPLVHADGRMALVLDGRLDNRTELIATLSLPTTGRVLPDGAVLAAALERWGPEVASHLRGDFAFAAWDMAERRLLLVCDQMGGRSLYVHVAGDRLYFTTAVGALLSFPEVPRDLDEVTLAHALNNHFPPAVGRSPYAAIAMLPGAGRLVWQDGRLRQDRYWRPDFGKRIHYRRDDEYVEAARELLDQAVRERLRADGPVACHLSSGLDSAAIAATAARIRAPEPLDTLTLVPDPTAPLPREPRYYQFDEWSGAEAMAARYPNIRAHRVETSLPSVDEEDELRHFRLVGWPVRQAFNTQWFDCMRPTLSRLGTRVVLTGGFGNATLSYDGLAGLADRIRGLRLWGVTRDLSVLQRGPGIGIWALKNYGLRPLAPYWLVRLRHWLRGTPRPFTALNPAFAPGQELLRQWDRSRGSGEGRSHAQRMLSGLIEHAAYGHAIRSAMRPIDGFDTRDPLGDLRLLEFCFAIPPEQYIKGGQIRSLARRALADRLPPQVLDNDRRGKQNPEWFAWMSRRRDSLAADLEALERSPTAARTLDLPRLKALLDDWPADADAAEARGLPLRAGLGRAVRVGRFIRWAEGAN